MNVKAGNNSLSTNATSPNGARGGSQILVDPIRIPAQNLPGGDLRIPVAALNMNLQFLVPRPPVGSELPKDQIDVFVRRVYDGVEVVRILDRDPLGEDVASRVWPKELFVPLANLVEGKDPANEEAPTTYELVYVLWRAGANPSREVITQYIIDKTAPYRRKTGAGENKFPPTPEFPLSLPPGRVIDDIFIEEIRAAGADIQIDVTYPNFEAGVDKVSVFFGLIGDPSTAKPIISNLSLPATGIINLPVKVFEDLKEGINRLTFTVVDGAGNLSKVSNPNDREVKRLAAPVPLPPRVPLADGTGGDKLIDLADCLTGVTIVAPVPLPATPSDSLRAYYGPIPLSEQVVGTQTEITWNVDYDSVIKPTYANSEGIEIVPILYEMFRGPGAPIAQSSVDIDVDISYTGPLLPNEPDPVNTLLAEAVLHSFSGGTDALVDNDYGQPADIVVKLWDAPPTQTGQEVTIRYGDKPLAPIRLIPGQEGQDVSAKVDWATIESEGGPSQIISWVLTTTMGNNPIYSPEKTIPVNVSKIVLPKPEVQNLQSLAISCPTLNFLSTDPSDRRRNLRVRIPVSPSMVVGETITLTSRGYEDEGASNPITPDTKVELDIPIVTPIPGDFYEVDIGDYFDNFKPASAKYIKLSYTISGVTPPSDPAIHFVFLLDHDDNYCEISYPIPPEP